MQQYKNKSIEAYHATVETSNHTFVIHIATNNKDDFMFFLDSFCDTFPDDYWIVHGIGKANAHSADCPIYDRVYYMRERLLKGWTI